MTSDLNGPVLVVDDTPSKRYVLASWLRRGGYDVVEASTGAEALDIVGRGGVALVVLDVRLPDLTGFEVCERIKSDPVHGNIPVIHASAAAIHAEDRTQGLERGADAYLIEPIDPDELLATIASVLRYFQARRHAEKLAERLAGLARVTVAMSGSRTEAELLDTAVRGATTIFGTPAMIVSVRPDGSVSRAMCPGPGQPARLDSPVGAIEPPVGVAYHDVRPAGLPDLGWPEDTVRVLTVRLRPDQAYVSVIVPTAATAEGAPVLTLLGQAVMSATNLQRTLHEEHDLALTLQRSLLPREVPAVPGWDLAVRYEPASDRAEIGGDFYEVAQLNGQLMVAVGDVGGHSLHAATVMAELRHATRAYLAEGHHPAAVIDRLNSLMTQLMPDEIATLCLLAIDLESGRVRMANAGHPPPLARTSGGVRRVEGRSPLLGLRAGETIETGFVIERGDTVVLYTDGLVELRQQVFDAGIDRLAAAMATVDDDLEAFAGRLVAEVGPDVVEDDIAMLVIRRRG
jgi:CheY-like chemotaxis protein